MEQMDLYRDIAERTQGSIYLGVVGPVRTGKSTFIASFMEQMVLPNIENQFQRERTLDEMPQSGAGRTIMTTQPHFVPGDAVEIVVGEGAKINIRLVDCVGYMVKGAMGYLEDGEPRKIRTPWFDHEIPFEEAAEVGTRKVITEHSTIGVVVTTDGTVAEIPRSNYIEAEERVVGELKALGKPFVIVLNTAQPQSEDAKGLAEALSEKYDAPVLCLNVKKLTQADIQTLLEKVLYEFPLRSVQVDLPGWVQALAPDHWLLSGIIGAVRNAGEGMARVRDIPKASQALNECEYVQSAANGGIRLGEGVANVALKLDGALYYRVLSEECGVIIRGDDHLLALLKEFAGIKREYDRVKYALDSVRETGYGLVSPTLEEMKLEEPEIVRQGSRFGVRLKASAPSLHLMRVDIQTEVSPVVGTEKQSEELVRYLLSEFENDPARIWQTNIFGKSLHELVKEGLSNKLARMPEDAQLKIAETLQRIINEGSGGLLCILL